MGRKKKAVAYLRVSGLGQVAGDGFPRQRKAIKAWAARENVNVVEWYVEPGVSGKLIERPALRSLIADLEENLSGVELVVVENTDRLARKVFTQEAIIDDLHKHGVSLHSATEGDLDGDPNRVLIRQVKGAFAEYARATLCLKLASARDRKRRENENGTCEGRKPFGVRPGEAETVDRIKGLRRMKRGSRMSYGKVAASLNEEGRLSRSGKPWAAGSVRQIVHRLFPAMA